VSGYDELKKLLESTSVVSWSFKSHILGIAAGMEADSQSKEEKDLIIADLQAQLRQQADVTGEIMVAIRRREEEIATLFGQISSQIEEKMSEFYEKIVSP
jgi:hypothetical protein